MSRWSGIILLALLTAACFVLETRLEAFGIRPNLTVLPVYFMGLRYGPAKGVFFGALVGSIADSLSGHLLGPNLLSKGTAGLLASALTGGFLRWNPILGAIGLFVITWADGLISLGALSVFAKESAGMADAAQAMLAQATINAAFGALLKPVDED